MCSSGGGRGGIRSRTEDLERTLGLYSSINSNRQSDHCRGRREGNDRRADMDPLRLFDERGSPFTVSHEMLLHDQIAALQVPPKILTIVLPLRSAAVRSLRYAFCEESRRSSTLAQISSLV